jgi:Raf kinase inhibitor-like YbhB/YbcL family protein
MTASLTRPVAPDPYSLLPAVPAFELRSDDVRQGERVPDAHTNTSAGRNVSPHLAWSGFPAETQSFLVTCFDPDAPGPAGWWHWTLVDVPASTTELARGVGTEDGTDLPHGAFQLRGDDGVAAYQGAAPPPGDQVHRYFFVVHALDVPSLGLDRDTLPGKASTAAVFHTLARAVLVGTYQTS